MTIPRTQITLQEYFRHELAEGKTEFRVVLQSEEVEGVTRLYIKRLGRQAQGRGNVSLGLAQAVPV